MSFPGNNDDLDTAAFRAAIEAVVGLLAKKAPINQETVHEWLETTLAPVDPSRSLRARAMMYAQRIFDGPLPPAASFGDRAEEP